MGRERVMRLDRLMLRRHRRKDGRASRRDTARPLELGQPVDDLSGWSESMHSPAMPPGYVKDYDEGRPRH
jgi:hypothetical protein